MNSTKCDQVHDPGEDKTAGRRNRAKHPARNSPPEPRAYEAVKNSSQQGAVAEEPHARGTFGARQEGVARGSPETHGCTSG